MWTQVECVDGSPQASTAFMSEEGAQLGTTQQEGCVFVCVYIRVCGIHICMSETVYVCVCLCEGEGVCCLDQGAVATAGSTACVLIGELDSSAVGLALP